MTETRVASLASLAQGITKVAIGETKLILVREGDAIRAFEGTCPHAKAPLEQGALCDGRIICPWHMAAFDAQSGALLEPVAMRGLQVHAVRLDGDAVLVADAPTQAPSPATHGDNRVFVLVGAGAAGAMAAVTLREAGFAGRIVLVGPDAAEPLDRTQLSKMALSAADFDRGTLPLLDADTMAGLAIEREVAAVTAIDPAARQLTLSTGRVLAYDAALLATGAAPVRIDIPGSGLPHVATLRGLGDVDAILGALPEGGRMVVIGTSFIGMEAAAALAERGAAVTVVGQDALPFARLFGERVGGAIRQLHEGKGIEFRLGAKVSRITAAAVELASGEKLPADVVVLGVGVAPVLDYAGGLARAPDGGLVVDASLRVADGLWAAGDIASPAGWPRIEHWRVAQQHGRIAAFGILGREATYEGVPFFWTAQHGQRLHSLGHATDWDEVAYDGDVEAFDFIAWYLKQGIVVAALLCARDRAAALLSHAMRGRLSLAEARALVA